MEEDADADSDPDLDGDANKSLLVKLKNKINSLTKKGKPGSVSVDDGASDKLKKKKSLIIKVVVVAALGIILFYDDLVPPSPVEVDTNVQPTPKYKKRVPKDVAVVDEKTAPAETAEVPAETAEVPAETAEVPAETAEVPAETTEVPAETAEVPAKTAEVPAETAEVPAETAEVPAETAEAPAEVTESVTTVDDTDLETNLADSPEDDSSVTEASPEDPADVALDLSSGSDMAYEGSSDTIDENIPLTTEEDLTDKILQDLEKQVKTTEGTKVKKEYVPPPEYEYTGRGLVYNCAGKHWACVDGASYKICEENAASLKFLKRPVECYPFNVYQNLRGCEGMQNRMVSSSAKTAFCIEN